MIRKRFSISLILLLLAGSISGCGEKEERITEPTTAAIIEEDTTESSLGDVTEEITESTIEITTEATTEATTEVTTEENEAKKLGYDKTFIHNTGFGGNYAIPEKFEKTNEENVQSGLWYEFTDQETGIVLETWEDRKYTRKSDYLANTRERIEENGFSLLLDEGKKIIYTGINKDSKYFVEIDTLYENVYHYIIFTSEEAKKELCDEIAEIVDEKTTYDKIEGVSGRLPLLLFGGTYKVNEEEISSFTDEEVIEAINEMYAYKGLIFEEQDLNDYFNDYSWYNPSVMPADFRNSVFSNSEKENLKMLRLRVDYTPAGIPTGKDVSSYDVETIRNKIIEYYTNKCNPEGSYVIFDMDETNTDTEYSTILRYQVSDEEAQEIIDSGRIPDANVYVCKVTLNKLTGEATDDSGESWFME